MPKKKGWEVERCDHFIMNPIKLMEHLRDGCAQVLPRIQAWAAGLLLKPDWRERVGLTTTLT